MNYITRFIKDDTGATAVEYSIMVALIAAVIISTVLLLGEQLNELFEGANSEMAKHDN